jgi:DNA mismatch repair protein MSH3
MTLNGNTITNLELLRNTTDFKETGSLIGVLDQCKTPMGKRLLRKWLSKPLTSIESVNNRLEAITEILDSTSTTNLALSRIRELLKTLPDLERGLSRIHFGRASPNELLRVLEALTKIGTLFDDLNPPEEGGGGGGESSCSGDFGLKSQLLKDTVKELPKVRGIVKGLVDQVNGKMARDGRKEDLFVREQDWPELVVSSSLWHSII